MEDGPRQSSIITSRSTVITTAFPINSPVNSWKPAYTAITIEIFHGGKRVASHARSSAPTGTPPFTEHMPKSHQAHLEWTPSRLIHWAETVGPATAQVVRTHSGKQAASGDGLSRLSRHHASGKDLFQ